MKYIVSIDCETTGLDQKNDYIIQLSAVKFNPETFEVIDTWDNIILPLRKFIITKNALNTHSLTEEYVKAHGKTLKELGQSFLDFIKDCDYLSYNGNSFDFKFLIKDFSQAGFEFPVIGKIFYDAYAMECKINPRDLSSVYKKYIGDTFDDAHNSLNDSLATIKIFEAQQKVLKNNTEELNKWRENHVLTFTGSIRYTSSSKDNEMIVFSYGKYKDSDVYKIALQDTEYFKWYMTNVADDLAKVNLRKYFNIKHNNNF